MSALFQGSHRICVCQKDIRYCNCKNFQTELVANRGANAVTATTKLVLLNAVKVSQTKNTHILVTSLFTCEKYG